MKENVIAEMVKFFGTDYRRTAHALKVAAWTETLGALEGFAGPALEQTVMAAALHDVGIKIAEDRFGSCTFNQQEELGPPAAAAILSGLSVPEESVDRIRFLIGHHHHPDSSEDPDFRLLIEADYLVNLEEGNIPLSSLAAVERDFRTPGGKEFLALMFGHAS
jgi:hypothetical protein